MCLLLKNYHVLHTITIRYSWKLIWCDWSYRTSCYIISTMYIIVSSLYQKKINNLYFATTPPLLMYSRDVSSVEKLLYITCNRILMKIEMVWLELRNKLLHYFHHLLFLLFLRKRFIIYTVPQHFLCSCIPKMCLLLKNYYLLHTTKIFTKIKIVWL